MNKDKFAPANICETHDSVFMRFYDMVYTNKQINFIAWIIIQGGMHFHHFPENAIAVQMINQKIREFDND